MYTDGDTRPRCGWKHVCCFFMCYDTPLRRAYAWWMLATTALALGVFLGAYHYAQQHGYRHEFGVVWHLMPLILIAFAHFAFVGMTPDDETAVSTDTNIDPVMRRCFMAVTLVTIGILTALFLVTLPIWWSPKQTEQQYVFGAPPKHANPTRRWGLNTPSVTPSQTPSSSPDPHIRRHEYYTDVDQRATVGGLYMTSAVMLVIGVLLHYNLCMVVVFTG